MSKKLLNESTIRRFAGLAGIGADVVSNFINEAYSEEEKMEEEVVSEEEEVDDMMDPDPDADAEKDMGDMMDMGAEEEEEEEEEEEGDAEALVSDIVAKLQDLAKMAGVDIDVEMGDEEDELGEMKYKSDDNEPMEEGEGTLAELINNILAEESEELEEANCGPDDKMEEEVEEGLYGDGRHTKKESKTQDQEEVVQEVLRRVRERLAQKTEQ